MHNVTVSPLLFLMPWSRCSYKSSSYQRRRQNLLRLRTMLKGTQPAYDSTRTRMQMYLTSIRVFNHWVILSLPVFHPGNKSSVWPECAKWWINFPLMDMNISFSWKFFFGCHIFYLGCPLNAIAWGSLNKAHTSRDTCWDAFWRTFGLARPWRTKKELYKLHSSWSLQNNTA